MVQRDSSTKVDERWFYFSNPSQPTIDDELDANEVGTLVRCEKRHRICACFWSSHSTEHNARLAEMVQLRFFTGLSIEATVRVLDISPATVKRDWSYPEPGFSIACLDGVPV